MTLIQLPTHEITDFESFHRVSQQVFGFPDSYSMNMDAWIDWMSGLDEDEGLSRVSIAPGEQLEIEVLDTVSFIDRVPEVFQAFVESTAYVNQRRSEAGKRPLLLLMFS